MYSIENIDDIYESAYLQFHASYKFLEDPTIARTLAITYEVDHYVVQEVLEAQYDRMLSIDSAWYDIATVFCDD